MLLHEITPLVLTRDEEANIGRTLDRLRWARQILVVDSHSVDRTLAIAARHPQVSIYSRAFDTFASQLNAGLEQVGTPWVLALDADYVLSDSFAGELAELEPGAGTAGYFARFTYCLHGRPLRGSLYPPRVVLFRAERGRYVADGHSQHLRLDGAAAWLSSPIYHDDRKPMTTWLAAQERYTSLEVAKLSGDAERLSFADRIRRRKWLAPLLVPAYCLFVKRLALDGRAGLFYTLQRTYAELLLSLRLLEHELAGGVAQNEQKATTLDESTQVSEPGGDAAVGRGRLESSEPARSDVRD